MYVENANRASQDAIITPDNLEPNPKNPIIASFFRNIGYADQLGSGVRNLFKYSKCYSGKEPEFVEGDVFRIIVPLDNQYSYGMETTQSATQITQSTTQLLEQKIIDLIKQNPKLSQSQMAEILNADINNIKYYVRKLHEKGMLERKGTSRKGYWVIK